MIFNLGLLLVGLTLLPGPGRNACAKATGDTDEPSLQKVEATVQKVVQKAIPATVGIGSENIPAGGSGVIVSEDGLILTAAHVIAATGDDILVYFPDGRRLKARKVGANNDADAAMVQITEEGKYSYMPVGNSTELETNDWLIAVGHAEGFQPDRTPPVRLGRLLGRDRTGFLTTDCTLIGGDSGGPLFNLKGEVVGIHSNIGNTLTMNNHVSIKQFHSDWERMKSGETWGRRFGPRVRPDPKQPILGIMPRDESSDEVTLNVLPGSPAAEAGVQSGDVLLKIDGQELEGYATVRKTMAKKKAGDEVPLVVSRDGKEQTILVKTLSRAEAMRGIQRAAREQATKEAKDKPPEKQPPTDEELDFLLRAMIDQARAKGNRLELDSDQLNAFGGMRRFMERLRATLDPEELAEVFGQDQVVDEHLASILKAFQDVVNQPSLSVIPLLQKRQQVALATAIREDGYLLTKASEIKDRKLTAYVDEVTQCPVSVVQTFPKYDLALIHIDAELIPVRWHVTEEEPSLGSIVAAVGAGDLPVAVGVVSVTSRNLSGSDKGYLGVELTQNVRIRAVRKDSPADKAGLKEGDILTHLDGKKMTRLATFVNAIKNKRPGDQIRLGFLRGEEEKTTTVELASREALPMHDATGRYPTGGELSRQRNGYPSALQTDLPIRPEDCGCPIVNLQGHVIGINIARAGRIKSYAIPASTIEAILRDVAFSKTTD